MENSILINNLDSLVENNNEIVEAIKARNYELMDNIDIFTETARTGDNIIKVRKDGRMLYIDGKYNPRIGMEQWFDGQKKFEYESVIMMHGIGSVLYLNKLSQELKDSTTIIIYEPCINILVYVLTQFDLTEVFKKCSITLIADGINGEKTKDILNGKLDFDRLSLLHHLTLGNYPQLFPEQIMEIFQIEKKRIEAILSNCGTIIRFTDISGKNVLNNIRYLSDNYTTFQLKDILPDDFPCIIVSAGPSLNKNIQDLKLVGNRACIIATDTALKPLLNYGILPHFFVIVDGKKSPELFEHELLSEIPMVMSSVASHVPVNMHKGKKFFSWDGTLYESELFKEATSCSDDPEKINITALPTGGSVATSAFSLAKLMGTKTIILVGQDLALTGNKTHADGTFQETMEEIDTSQGNYIKVEDIYGGTVLTRPDFKAYLDWFNDEIESHPEYRVIDATEGGAKIKGTEILTLKETIEKVCNTEMDIKEVLNNISPVFHEEKVNEKVLEYFQSTPKRMLQIKKKVKQGIGHYEKMIKLCNQDRMNSDEFKKITKKITKINEFVDNDAISLMVVNTIKDVDFSIRSQVYKTQDDEKEEGIMIANQGITLLKAMLKSIDELVEIAEETVGKAGCQ